MENLALQLNRALRGYMDVTLLANRHGRKALPLFLPFALARAAWLTKRGCVDAVLLSDATLAPLARALKRIARVPIAATVHGLDLTYRSRLYQGLLSRTLSAIDLALPNSRATQAVLNETFPSLPSHVVPLGVNPLPQAGDEAARSLRDAIGLDGNPVLLTSGRLIKRKGVAWFTEHVLPALPESAIYVVAGGGAEADAVRNSAKRVGVESRVRVLGRVSDAELAAAYRAADIFVMPNIPVPGDMEGFGLVALEASSAGLPVVASRLEGITEAVRDGENGILVEPQSADAYATVLRELLSKPKSERSALGERFRAYTDQHYSWDRTAESYVVEIRRLVEAAT